LTSDFNLLPWPTTPEFVRALIKIKSIFQQSQEANDYELETG